MPGLTESAPHASTRQPWRTTHHGASTHTGEHGYSARARCRAVFSAHFDGPLFNITRENTLCAPETRPAWRQGAYSHGCGLGAASLQRAQDWWWGRAHREGTARAAEARTRTCAAAGAACEQAYIPRSRGETTGLNESAPHASASQPWRTTHHRTSTHTGEHVYSARGQRCACIYAEYSKMPHLVPITA